MFDVVGLDRPVCKNAGFFWNNFWKSDKKSAMLMILFRMTLENVPIELKKRIIEHNL